MTGQADFSPFRILRRTRETEFALLLGPRVDAKPELILPNRIISHFIGHFSKAAGIQPEIIQTDWPGSWAFDHVLCEDLGQLFGRGIAVILARRSAASGVPGRAHVGGVMDDALVDLTLSFEGRPGPSWSVPEALVIDGFVDSWYDAAGITGGSAHGTNLRQFIDGFALGSGATIHVSVRRAGNLHHLYEAVFRALGDAVRIALDLQGGRLPGDSSGLAGTADYEVSELPGAPAGVIS